MSTGLIPVTAVLVFDVVALTSCVFIAVVYAGLALITGTVFALIYVFSRSIWPSIIAHASFDLSAVAMIYFQVEAAVAHSVYG